MATGDIGSVKATLEFEPTNISGTPGFIHISGDVYAIFYFAGSNTSHIKTYTITDTGSITLIDSKSFATRFGIIDVIYISGTIYAFVAQGNDGDGWLRTVSIADNGTIGAVVETLEFDITNASYPKIISVSGTVYAITYTDVDSDGWIKTVNIDADGTNLSIINTYEFENVHGFNPHMLKVFGTTYAIVYIGTNNDGYVKTITIEDNGTIGSVLNTLKFEDDPSNDPEIVKIDGDVYAIIYGKVANVGWIRTLTISGAGVLVLVDSGQLEVGNCDYPSTIYISKSSAGNIIAVAYSGPSGDGWVKTVEIADNGNILSIVDSLEFDIVSASAMKFIAITDDIYAIAYVFTQGSDGWLKTVDIETLVSPTVTFPSNAITRVTGIRHIYRPGMFRMMLSLGEVSNTMEIAEHMVRRELEIPERKFAPFPEVPELPRTFPTRGAGGEILTPEMFRAEAPTFPTRGAGGELLSPEMFKEDIVTTPLPKPPLETTSAKTTISKPFTLFGESTQPEQDTMTTESKPWLSVLGLVGKLVSRFLR